MINLATWFKNSARRPLMTAVGLVVVLCLGYNSYMFLTMIRAQKTSIDQLASLTSIALAQKNRPMIESVLNVARLQLDATSTFVCTNGKVAVAVNYLSERCTGAVGFLEYSTTRDVGGFVGTQLVFLYSIPRMIWPVVLSFLFGLSAVVLFWQLLGGIQQRLNADLLTPLANGLLNDEPLKILELNDLRIKQRESADLKVKNAVSRAIFERNVQIAHDIRSPLSALNIGVQMLKIVDVAHRELIFSAIGRIDGIASQLLGTENINGPENYRWCRLSELVESTIREVSIQLPQNSGIQIAIDFSDEFAVHYAALPSESIRRIVSNLLHNSIEAFTGGGKIQVIGRTSYESMSVEIKDNGTGIASELLDRVGQRGFTTKTNSVRSGSGLGLFAANQTIAALGGTFEIQSVVGQGTSARIALPTQTLAVSIHNCKAQIP